MDPSRATKMMRDMMQDPSMVSHRIFVGLLPTDTMTPKELEDIFEPYGKISGVLLNRGFGFVQFESVSSAIEAVAANGRIFFMGKKLDVKPARPMNRPVGMMRPNYEERDRSPLGMRDPDFVDKGREPSRFPVQKRFPAPVPSNPDRANDCEIIVVNKSQTEYAEYIEQKLRRMGMIVDLLFPNEDVPVARVLTNIANRGCLFAIVIMPQNEEHRSITLNILHGPPQEHRNMPLEDAVALVSRSFDAYVLREKTGRPSEVPVAPASVVGALNLTDPHPESIQVLLNLLAENRVLTVIQYDKVIAYLQGRREMQVKVELGDAGATVPSTIGLPSLGLEKQQTLQSRILSILNNKAAAGSHSGSNSSPIPATSSPSGNKQSPLLADPSVQQALSSLMQGNLLRKLSEPR